MSQTAENASTENEPQPAPRPEGVGSAHALRAAPPTSTPAPASAVKAPRAPSQPIQQPAQPSTPIAPPSRPGLRPRSERPRADRAPRRAVRRTRVVVRRVSPLSVLKFSLIFYLCVMLVVFFALLIIYTVLSAAGAIESLGELLGYVFGTGTSTEGRKPVEIDGGQVFKWVFIGGLVFAVVWSFINVFVAFLYNLISDIVGGIEVTLAEKPQR